MEMSLVNEFGKPTRKNDEEYTRFKLSNKKEGDVIALILNSGGQPTKQSSMFTYFDVKGDYLNGEKRIKTYLDVAKVVCDWKGKE